MLYLPDNNVLFRQQSVLDVVPEARLTACFGMPPTSLGQVCDLNKGLLTKYWFTIVRISYY